MSDILKKIGEKVQGTASALKSLAPGDSEAQGIAETQKQVDALGAPVKSATPAPAPVMPAPTEAEKANPLTRYGAKPGEKRLDTSYMDQPSAIKAPVYDRGGEVGIIGGTNNNVRPMPTMRLPAYDNGGEVKKQQGMPIPEEYNVGEDIPKEYTEKPAPEYTSRYSAEAAVANRPKVGMPKIHMDEDRSAYQRSPLPMYDEGGDVDVNDGNHEAAILQGGERVLTPEENEQYKAEHQKPSKVEAPSPALKTQDAHSTEEGQPLAATPPPAPEKLPTASHEERLAIKTDQQQAMGQGVNGLTKLGLANIHAKQLGLQGQTEDAPAGSITSQMKSPEGLNQGAKEPTLGKLGGDQSAAPAPAPAAPGYKPLVAPDKSVLPSKELTYEEQLQQLKNDHKSALAERTPDGKVKADYIQEQINDLHKNTPWGSPGNHPGILGKIGHVAAKVGNIAGDVLEPGIMSLIPGTDLNNRAQEAGLQGRTTADQKTATEQQNANTAETSAKNTGTVSQQYAQALREKAAADQSGDATKIAAADRAVADAKAAVDESKPVAKVPTGDETLGPELVTQYNKELADRYQVLNPGKQLPQEFMLPSTATANDYNRRHTAMEGVEKATGVKTQQDTTNEQKTAAAAVHKEEHAGKLYDDYTKQVEKNSAPMEAISSRSTLLLHNLDAKDKQADAQVAPELLSIASGGVGSGLRMNEAEISRVVGGRSVWDSLISMANKVREGEGTFSDEQRAQMHKIGEYIYDRAAAVTVVYGDVKDHMLSHKDNPDQVRKDYNDAKRIANQIIRQGIVPQGGEPKDGDFVFHNGQVLIVKGGKGHPVLQ
jgi:hypothetical protein